jgi:hypothetical protein
MVSEGSAQTTPRVELETAYNDLKRLIPSLAAELELLRTSLREHSLWLLRYGHTNGIPAAAASQDPSAPAPAQAAADVPPSHASTESPSQEAPTAPASSARPGHDPELPAYSASDVPPYTGGFSSVSASTREEVRERRDQLVEWLREGEDVLREYSARYAQLAQELGLPHEDLLGTWSEMNPDNALPGYQVVEENEDLMVGVGEVPPPYVHGGRVDFRRLGSRGSGDASEHGVL